MTRIRWRPRVYLDVDDPAEVEALREALMICEGGHPNLDWRPFDPFITPQDVSMFLRGRRHALGQSPRNSGVYNQKYEERIQA